MIAAATPRERLLAELGILLVVLCWAANFVVVKGAIADLPPLVFTGIRYVLASLALLALLRWRSGTIALPRRDLGIALGLGALGFGVYQILWISGLTRITAGESALLVATSPVVVALVAAPLGVERLTASRLGGVLISFVGVALVIGTGSGLTIGASLVGDLLTLLGTVAWATYTVLIARAMRTIDVVPLTAWSVVGGTLVILPLAAWEASITPDLRIEPGHVAALVYSGVLAAGLANVLVSHAVRLVGPTRVTAFQYAVPPLAVLLGALFLAEPVRIGQLVGGLIVIAGVVLTRREPAPVATARAGGERAA